MRFERRTTILRYGSLFDEGSFYHKKRIPYRLNKNFGIHTTMQQSSLSRYNLFKGNNIFRSSFIDEGRNLTLAIERNYDSFREKRNLIGSSIGR